MNYKDLAERTLATAAQAFLAVFVVTDLSTTDSAVAAATAAGLAVLKSFAASKVGTKGTAGLVV
mgnify:CR=1 FL=1|jgi:hypothetical protein